MSRVSTDRIYDRACELLDAAQGLRRAVPHGAGQEETITAVLGCIAATLDDLAVATGDLRRHAHTVAVDEQAAARAGRALAALGDQLGDAAETCERARRASAGVGHLV